MRPRARAPNVLLALLACGACVGSAGTSRAFPGIAVSVTDTTPEISTTELVVMEHAGVSIVTLAVDYQGPIQRFALLLPVPGDVERGRLETVKHEFIARLEQVTAPRVFEFWEQDPCVPGAPEQAWQEKVPVKNRGFLTPEVMPPRDAHYPVSNELSIPAVPDFKQTEDEFSYQLLRPKSSAELGGWLGKRGYRFEAASLEPLLGALGNDAQLLVAEVAVDRAELIDSERLQLGGIRYWSRRPLLPIAATLGRAHYADRHDLFVYGLHREKRYQAANLQNVFAPTNLRVAVGVGARVGTLYNTLFERLLGKHAGAAVTEFVGPSDECGEPCSNAPLQLRELLTFGGDVLEAQPGAKRELAAAAAELSEAARSRLAGGSVAPAASGEDVRSREQQALERQLALKRALLARQRYVLTRLHMRTRAGAAPNSLELAATDAHQSGGYGVPRGPNAELVSGVRAAKSSRYQVRFYAAHPWAGAMPCAKPERWRWGKRWKSHTQHWRGVDVARDLLRVGEDPKLVDTVLLGAVPEVGFTPRAASVSSDPKPKSKSQLGLESQRESKSESDTPTCAFDGGRTGSAGGLVWIAVAYLVRWRRRSVGVWTRAQSRR